MNKGKPYSNDNFYCRRSFLKKAMKGVSSVAVGSFAISVLKSCTNQESLIPSDPLDSTYGFIEINIDETKNSDLKSPGGIVILLANSIDKFGLLLVRESDTQIRAFSRNCTYLDCDINEVDGMPVCSCHNCRYGNDGEVLSGLAIDPLIEYETIFKGSILKVYSKIKYRPAPETKYMKISHSYNEYKDLKTPGSKLIIGENKIDSTGLIIYHSPDGIFKVFSLKHPSGVIDRFSDKYFGDSSNSSLKYDLNGVLEGSNGKIKLKRYISFHQNDTILISDEHFVTDDEGVPFFEINVNDPVFEDKLSRVGGSVVLEKNFYGLHGLVIYRWENNVFRVFRNSCSLHDDYKLEPIDSKSMLKCSFSTCKFASTGYPVNGPATNRLFQLKTIYYENDGLETLKIFLENMPTDQYGNPELYLNTQESPYSALASDGSIAIASNQVDSKGLLITRSGNTIRAFSRKCTFDGCVIGEFENGESLCPCNGSRYDMYGKPLSGGATKRLTEYVARLNPSDSNEIQITSTKVIHPVDPVIKSFKVNLDEDKYSVLRDVGAVMFLLDADEFDPKGFIIFRKSSSEIRVFSAACTHNRCTLKSHDNGVTTCPCHSSKFNVTTGAVLSGPAEKNLPEYKNRFENNIIEIISEIVNNDE